MSDHRSAAQRACTALGAASVLALALTAGAAAPAPQAMPSTSPSSAAASGGAPPTLSGPTAPGHGPHVLPMRPRTAPLAAASSTLAGPAGAHLTYFGGRVVSNISVVEVLWGTGSYPAHVTSTGPGSMAAFFPAVLNSPFVDWLGTEYSTTSPLPLPRTNQTIGRGSYVGQFTITPRAVNNGSVIDDVQIQAELKAQIAAGTLPAPTSDAASNTNTYYAVFFPHGRTITTGGLQSCVIGGFSAFHGTIANASGHEVYYGVHPDMQAGSGCEGQGGTGTAFGNQTTIASHELVETMTDPEVGLSTILGPPLAWDDNTNGEIGDICNSLPGTTIGADGVTYDVQHEWSNARNACFVASAPPNDFALNVTSPTASVATGHSSDALLVAVAISSGVAQPVTLSVSGLPTGVTASLSPTTVTSGGSATVTFTALPTAPVGTANVTLTGTAGSVTHATVVALTVAQVSNVVVVAPDLVPVMTTLLAGSSLAPVPLTQSPAATVGSCGFTAARTLDDAVSMLLGAAYTTGTGTVVTPTCLPAAVSRSR